MCFNSATLLDTKVVFDFDQELAKLFFQETRPNQQKVKNKDNNKHSYEETCPDCQKLKDKCKDNWTTSSTRILETPILRLTIDKTISTWLFNKVT